VLVKVKKVSLTLKSSIACLALSLVFLHVISSMHFSKMAFEGTWPLKNMGQNWWVLVLAAYTVFLLLRGRSWSSWSYLVTHLLVWAKLFSYFFADFNKTILIFDVLYLLVIFTSWAQLRAELKQALYVPGFTAHDTEKFFNYDLPVHIAQEDGSEVVGHITRCSSESCFLVLDSPLAPRQESLRIVIRFGGKEFTVQGEVHTTCPDGIGVKILEFGRGIFPYSWKDFLEVVQDRGHRLIVHGLSPK
jgi:hypothetical protein